MPHRNIKASKKEHYLTLRSPLLTTRWWCCEKRRSAVKILKRKASCPRIKDCKWYTQSFFLETVTVKIFSFSRVFVFQLYGNPESACEHCVALSPHIGTRFSWIINWIHRNCHFLKAFVTKNLFGYLCNIVKCKFDFLISFEFLRALFTMQ